MARSGVPYEARIELTWANKSMRLLAPDDGSYEWTDPADHRVAEVRLIHDDSVVGRVRAVRNRALDNLLIVGDALHALTSLVLIPEFSKVYAGTVRLIYIDPPFNTRRAIANYDDNLAHSVWLTMMRDRLRQIEKLLAPNGSVWVHLNADESHYCKAIMDEVFTRRAFVGEIVWQKRTSRENRAAIGSSHDSILVYAPAGPVVWKQSRNKLPDEGSYANPDDDPRGPWRSIPLTAMGKRRNQMYTIVAPDGRRLLPPKGRCWSVIESEYNKLVAANLVYFPRRGKDRRPREKAFRSRESGLVPMTWWSADECDTTEFAKKENLDLFPEAEPFETPKPERLIERVVRIATNPGDLVLDCFAGSGTTAAVAHKLGRRWVAVERSHNVVRTYTLPRLKRVVNGADLGGISLDAGWKGGGGFRVVRIGPSMFEVAANGRVVLSDWATGGNLAKVVAAQCGFLYEQKSPFAGRKGRFCLAVVDGIVNEGVCRALIDKLDVSEALLVYGTAVDPLSRQILSSLRPGSLVKKIPQSLLDDYRLGVGRVGRLTQMTVAHPSATIRP